jgi:endoglucanase
MRARALVLVIAVVAIAAGVVVLNRPGDADPFAGRQLWTNPNTQVAAAADAATGADRATLEKLASRPTGTWLTPEAVGIGQVGPRVHDLVEAADDAVPVIVLYGVPGRDCSGLESAGGTAADAYVEWVDEAAEAADDAVVVLEPDALATADECGGDMRIALLRQAVDRLAAHHVTTYVDAGHSDWVSADRVAELLGAVGVDRVRGFAVNVSGYQPDADEVAFAEELRRYHPGAHYIIDSSRNGAGATSDWCNPPGRALGVDPSVVDDGSALDARLWVKPPGESDGVCHGGPPAGSFWLERALELARAAGM